MSAARPAFRTSLLLGVVLVAASACASWEAQAPDRAAPDAAVAPDATAPDAAAPDTGEGAPDAPRAERDALRPCTRADLLGTWQVVRMGAARSVTVDRSDPEYYPHQRYVFATNAIVRYLAAQKAITPEDHRALAAAAAAATWAVDETGRLLTQPDGAPRQEVSTCAVLLGEVRSEGGGVTGEPGDVLLTRLDAEGRAVSRRQLRRLDRAPE